MTPEKNQINLNDTIYHIDIYNSQEPLKVIGLREHEVEVIYDPSGGTQFQRTIKWIPRNGIRKQQEIKLGQVIYHTDINNAQKPLTIVGIRQKEVEITYYENDTKPQIIYKWVPINGIRKTKQTQDIKDNEISLLKEDIEIVHSFLDSRNIPRKSNEHNFTYSMLGRIKKLEEKFLNALSKIESECLKNNCPIDWDKI